MEITKDMGKKLKEPIDQKYLKQHPSKRYLTVINPMAVIERLNDVIGVGSWHWVIEAVSPPTKEDGRYTATAKGRLTIGSCIIEQFGGSTNDDAGDALKGAATDALTKCASYLGIGFEIYSGQSDRDMQSDPKPASDKQRGLIVKLMGEKEVSEVHENKIRDQVADEALTAIKASEIIDWLFKQADAKEG